MKKFKRALQNRSFAQSRRYRSVEILITPQRDCEPPSCFTLNKILGSAILYLNSSNTILFKNVSIDIRKLRDYCLNPQQPIGKHKARVFSSVLGIGRRDAKMLKEKIMAKMENAEIELAYEDPFGKRFIADLDIHINNRNARVRTIWIIKTNSTIPELVTCYVMI